MIEEEAMKKSVVVMAVIIIVMAITSCGNGEEKCEAGQIKCPDGRCVDLAQGCGTDTGTDGEEDVIGDETTFEEPDGEEGVGEGIDTDAGEAVPPDDGVEEGEVEEEPVCEWPCASDEDCDDNNVCTEIRCAPLTGCCVIYNDPWTTNYLPCGDDLFCNGVEYCYEGECYSEPLPEECDVTNPCIVSECDEENDRCYATPVSNGTPCDDGLYCTGENNTCQDGYCDYRNPCPEFTGDPCTQYVCYEDEPHCREEPQADGMPCPDSDACNGTEFCQGGTCSFVVPPCGDGDPCTEDVCSGNGDCAYNPISGCTPCDPALCDDSNICTADYCRMVGGDRSCENIPVHGCTKLYRFFGGKS